MCSSDSRLRRRRSQAFVNALYKEPVIWIALDFLYSYLPMYSTYLPCREKNFGGCSAIIKNDEDAFVFAMLRNNISS